MASESFLSPVEVKGLLGATEDIGGKAAADDGAAGLGLAEAAVEVKGLLGAFFDMGGKAAADDDAAGLGAAEPNGLGASFDIGGKAEFDFGTLEEDFDFVEIMGKAALDVDELEASSDFDFVELSFLVGDGFEVSSASR